MRDLRSALESAFELRDLGDLSAHLSRTLLATPRRVFAIAIALVVLMGAVTGVLAGAYHEARDRAATRQFFEGEIAASAGRRDQALDRYRAALALDRENSVYRRAVALSLIGLRRTTEAEMHVGELLRHDPIDGEANLLLARLTAGRTAYTETEASYQRAIYGRWPTDPDAHRLAARFELIEWLEQIGAQNAARAELLRLQGELPDTPFLQLETAKRLLALHEPAQAADILRRELTRRPDAIVAADLARAAMESGDFEGARDAARRALTLDPRDRDSRTRLDQATEVLSLDPNRRGLSSPERLRRSQRLLARVVTDLEACTGGAIAAAAPRASTAPVATPGPPAGTVVAPAGPAAAGELARGASRTPAAGTAVVPTPRGAPAASASAALGAPLAAPGQQPSSKASAAATAGAPAAAQGGAPWPAELSAAMMRAQSLLANDDVAAGATGATRAAAPARSSSNVQKPAGPTTDATEGASPTPAPNSPDARADARIAAAQTLWGARVSRCGASHGTLAWIFDRLAH